MGELHTITGADFSASPISFLAPVRSNLEFLNFYCDPNSTSPARNLAPGKPSGYAVGNPLPQSGEAFTRMSNTACVQTAVPDQDAVTLLVAGFQDKLPVGSFGYLLGSYSDYNSAPGANVAIDSGSAQGAVGIVGRAPNVFEEFGSASSLTTSMAFYAVRASSAYVSRIDDLTRGVSAMSSNGGPPARRVTANNFFVGASASSAVGGAVNVAFAAIYSRVLTDAELATTYAKIKGILRAKYAVAV